VNQLPFQNITDYGIENNFQSAKIKINKIMENHGIVNFLNENYLMDLTDPSDLNLCEYYAESEFNQIASISTR